MFKTAWSLPSRNINLNVPPPNYKKVAVIGAISTFNKDLKFITKQGKYFNGDDFVEFIKML